LAYLALIPAPRADGLLIGSDGIGYYAYARSIWLDGDLDFANEFERLLPASAPPPTPTATGLTRNQFALGPGLLWSPFFLAAHGIVTAARALGLPIEADGYGYGYQAAVCLGSMLYGFLGIALTFSIARRFWPRTALAACGLLWFGGNFVYYQVFEPSMSHMVSVFAVSTLLFAWLRLRPLTGRGKWFIVGLCAGLTALVRLPDVLLSALPLIDGWWAEISMKKRIAGSAAWLAGFALVFWPQMAVWQILNGSPFQSGYITAGQGFFGQTPQVWGVLFSTQHGLFLWHPVLAIAALGWVWLPRRMAILAPIGFLGQVLIIASWSSWAQGDAFGGRMFLACLPLFALGLSGALEQARLRWCRPAWLISAAILLWNALFVLQYRLGFIPMSGEISLNQLTAGKLYMLIELWRRLANLLQNR
jgi:hypothetical protein